MASMPTIVAVATGPAAGGIGIVRVSGPAALAAARALTTGLPSPVRPRHAHFTRFVDGRGAVLDEGLLLFFPGPASFTGEDVVELHAHGAPRLLRLLVDRVLEHPEVRLAQPGEFTRRAWLNGRIDLARAEAVAALVEAESELQVRTAAAQLSGELSRRVHAVRAELVDLRADLEAALDFPDESEGSLGTALARLAPARASVVALQREAARGALIARRNRVVLYGPTNAGKSTLFNMLCGGQRALVDPEPGTTRDALEVVLEVQGLSMTLVDTAGLRDEAGRLERLGIERTREALRGADVAVLVVPPEASDAEVAGWRDEAPSPARFEVLGKADQPGSTWNDADQRLRVSGLTGAGVEALRGELGRRLGGGLAEAAVASSSRHSEALQRAAEAMDRAAEAGAHGLVEVVAGEAGLALAALGDITGDDVSAQVQDAIFRRFCIGK